MRTELASLTWPEVGSAPTVLVPVGSIEQHGPHLPLDTDTAIAIAVTDVVADRLPGTVVVAPALSYGSSGEHQSFAGTSSIGSAALRLVVLELVRSLSTWAGRVVFVNAHGGNIAGLSSAVSQLVDERHDAAWVPCATEGVDLHAGITETSLMLHLRPASVRLDRAEPGDTRPLAEILPLLVSGGIEAVSTNGVLGDPTGASAEDGERLLAELAGDVLSRIDHGQRDERGMLARPGAGSHE